RPASAISWLGYPHVREPYGPSVAWTQLDVSRSIELAEAALAADPAPGAALDCLPQAGAAGAYSYVGRIDDAVDVMERGSTAAGSTADPWGAAQLATSLALVRYLSGSDTMADAAAQAVRLATVTANPTLIAYASAIRASTLIATQPDDATVQLEDARRLAERVHNRWLLDV